MSCASYIYTGTFIAREILLMWPTLNRMQNTFLIVIPDKRYILNYNRSLWDQKIQQNR